MNSSLLYNLIRTFPPYIDMTKQMGKKPPENEARIDWCALLDLLVVLWYLMIADHFCSESNELVLVECGRHWLWLLCRRLSFAVASMNLLCIFHFKFWINMLNDGSFRVSRLFNNVIFAVVMYANACHSTTKRRLPETESDYKVGALMWTRLKINYVFFPYTRIVLIYWIFAEHVSMLVCRCW